MILSKRFLIEFHSLCPRAASVARPHANYSIHTRAPRPSVDTAIAVNGETLNAVSNINLSLATSYERGASVRPHPPSSVFSAADTARYQSRKKTHSGSNNPCTRRYTPVDVPSFKILADLDTSQSGSVLVRDELMEGGWMSSGTHPRPPRVGLVCQPIQTGVTLQAKDISYI